jgi:hypothetical protein
MPIKQGCGEILDRLLVPVRVVRMSLESPIPVQSARLSSSGPCISRLNEAAEKGLKINREKGNWKGPLSERMSGPRGLISARFLFLGCPLFLARKNIMQCS